MVAALFAFLLATLGGSSRYDMLQISILLPVSCLAAGYGLYRSWDADWSALKVPLILLIQRVVRARSDAFEQVAENGFQDVAVDEPAP